MRTEVNAAAIRAAMATVRGEVSSQLDPGNNYYKQMLSSCPLPSFLPFPHSQATRLPPSHFSPLLEPLRLPKSLRVIDWLSQRCPSHTESGEFGLAIAGHVLNICEPRRLKMGNFFAFRPTFHLFALQLG